MGKAIGIDLGTTNTAVAVLVDGRPRVLEDEKGYKVLPSCVSVKPSKNGELQFVVGQAAKNLIVTKPDRTVYAVKRLMGRRYDSPEVQQIKRLVGFPIAEADDGTCKLKMGEAWYTPVEISALILDVAKTTAERTLGEPVDEAVITVPAYFNHAQRAATFEAAKKAGLRCDRLLNEPTAAALAYGHRRDIERTIVVYDLGGGTFDVSVLRLSHGVYEVLSTSGETHLGGEDFDQRVVEHLADEFAGQTGVDLRSDSGALQRVKDAGERAKCELSFTDRTSVLIPRITMADNLEATLTRLALEGLVEDLIQSTLEITKAAVRDAGLRINQVDEVILVGGQTRMPRVREAIGSLFQKEPSRTVHPEEVVAIGAAVHANSLTERAPAGAPHAVLLDVTPFDLGIDVVGGKFEPIIKRNSQVPTQATKTFYTNKDGQETVKVTVRQGEHGSSAQNEFLGEFVMTGLTAAARMSTKVEVTFRLDMNGMLHVSALEPGSGEKKRITIRNYAEYARTQGGVGVDVEGDVQAAEVAPPEAPQREGLLSRLFGGGKKKATAAPATPKAPPSEGIPEAPAFLDALERAEAVAPMQPGAGSAVPDLEVAGGGLAADLGLDLGPLTMADVGGGLTAAVEAEPLDISDLEELPSAGLEELDAADVFEDDSPEGFAMSEDDTPAFGDVFEAPEDDEPEDAAEALVEATEALDDLGELPDPFAPAPDEGPRPALAAAPGSLDPFADLGDPFADAAFDDAPLFSAGFGGPVNDDPFGGDGPAVSKGPAAAVSAPFGSIDPQAASAASGADDDGIFEFPEDDELLEALNAAAEASEAPESVERAHDAVTDGSPSSAQTVEPDEVEDFLASLTDEDDDLAALLGGVELDPAPTPPNTEASVEEARPAAAPFKPFRAVGGARPTDRTDIYERGTRSVSDFEDEDSDIALVVTRPPDPRPSSAPEAELDRLSFGGDPFGDVVYDDLPEDDFVQFAGPAPARTGDRPVAVLDEGDEEDVEDEDTDPGPSKPGVARLKVEYRRVDAMVKEYRDNLEKNGCFIKTSRPLKVGRPCEIEVRAPGLRRPLQIRGVVSWSSAGLSRLPAGQDAGMGIEYQLDLRERAELANLLGALSG